MIFPVKEFEGLPEDLNNSRNLNWVICWVIQYVVAKK